MRWDTFISPGKQGLISLWAPATLPELAVFFQRRQPSQKALCLPTHTPPDLCHRAKAGRTFHPTTQGQKEGHFCVANSTRAPRIRKNCSVQRQAWMFLMWKELSRERSLKRRCPIESFQDQQVFCSCCFNCPWLSCVLNKYPLRS